MVKRTIWVIIIALILVGLGTLEVIAVKKLITKLDNNVAELIPLYEENENDITFLTERVDNLKKEWDSDESKLCLMFNHKDMSSITDSITKLRNYTESNNYDDAIVEVHVLKEYAEKNFHIMGFNIHNIL